MNECIFSCITLWKGVHIFIHNVIILNVMSFQIFVSIGLVSLL
uniref:Uncharacterized protein n=1 Tax=Anguilla anguilla TaxID=7936 RepID=A0A0E9T5N6_ANGAN